MSGFYSLRFILVAAFACLTNSGSAVTATAVAGRTVKFSVSANGTAPFSYQWFKNNAVITGAVDSTYTLTAITTSDAGTYTARVTNSVGSITSDVAVLSVDASNPGSPGLPPPAPPSPPVPPPSPTPPPPPPSPTPPAAPPTSPVRPALQAGRLINVSVRGVAGADSQTLIVGFIVTGNGNLPVLIRGWGPELARDPFNVPAALGDPVLRTFREASQVAENDNWGSNSQIASVAAQVGAFPFSASSKDAAIFTSIAQGTTTAHIVSADGRRGVALAEVFDATSIRTAESPRLTNVSARAHVGTGGDVLIGGFIIGGETPVTVLLRAVGPTLTTFGVSGVLANPKLELHSTTGLLETNDNWSQAANVSAISALNGKQAFALPANSNDAVILTTLSPGVYSAIIKGINDSTGTALLEVYEVP